MTEMKMFNIVLVDDDTKVSKSLKRELKFLAKKNNCIFKIEEFQDPWVGYNYIVNVNNKVNLVITDLKMPFLSGDELVMKIKKMDPLLPIIILTAYATKESILALLKADKNCTILSKPWNPQKLAGEISRYLSIDLK